MIPLEIRQTNRELLRSHKKKCSICGETEYCCLETHHIKPKRYNISKAIKTLSTDLFKEELLRTICVCANCHRKIHNNKIKI